MSDQTLTVDGVSVPRLLYGTAWKEGETERLTALALRQGFRGIDTANQRKHYHAAAISRFASALDGLRSGYLDDPAFAEIVERDLEDGQHRNPTSHPAYFTTAFFHRPDEFRSEVEDAGLDPEHLLGVEGPAWLLADFDRHWDDPGRRERLLHVVRRLEAEPSTLGVSAHIVAVARK